MVELTDTEKEKILRRSNEAKAFLRSPLFVELDEWIKREEKMVMVAIAFNSRNANQTNLTRNEFVEQMVGYYRSLKTVVGQIKAWSEEDKQMKEPTDRFKDATA